MIYYYLNVNFRGQRVKKWYLMWINMVEKGSLAFSKHVPYRIIGVYLHSINNA